MLIMKLSNKNCKHPTCNGKCRRTKTVKKLVPLPKLKSKAVKVFNNYIRQRDKNLGCISCGGAVDHAGHYLNAGQHSALLLDEDNVNGQCVGCNCFRGGNLIRYRYGLVNKIGETAVKELERRGRDEAVKKWTREELIGIIMKYGQFVK